MRLLALSLLLMAGPIHARAASLDRLAPDAEARWVSFDLTPGNQMRFTMMLDGAPATAVLDTGVSATVVSRAYVDRHKLKVRAGGTAAAVGGAIPIGRVDARSIVIGGLTRTGAALIVAALPANATGSGQSIDLLVGRDLTAGYGLDIDFAQHRFRLLPSGRIPFAGATAPLSISPDRLVYISELIMGGARVKPVLVDTGDGASITLSDRAWQFVKPAAPRETSALSYGLGGPVVTGLAIFPHVVSGAVIASNVEVRVEPKGGFSDDIGMAGRIGLGFLQRYRVLLDPAAGHMILQPGKLADIPPLRSTSGLLVKADNGRLNVLHIMRGGPAETGGWKPGDAICSIDGVAVPTEYAGSAMAAWSIGAPGRVVTLGLCNGVSRQLTLAQFY